MPYPSFHDPHAPAAPLPASRPMPRPAPPNPDDAAGWMVAKFCAVACVILGIAWLAHLLF